jgi:hypothetical protein
MSDRTFVHTMLARGAQEWDWVFCTMYLTEAIDAFSRGISSARTLYLTNIEVQQAIQMYSGLLRQGYDEEQALDALRVHATGPLGRNDSPSEGGRHRSSPQG